jgi:hypothetical protein
MKTKILISFACVWISALQAQSRIDRRPMGLDLNLNREISAQTLATPNMTAIHAQDVVLDAQPRPRRFAYPVLLIIH